MISNTSNKTDEIAIDITEKTCEEIRQLLISTYLNGYSTIILEGINPEKTDLIQKLVPEFVAAEIMQRTMNAMSIRIFWDIQNISLQAIITRIGHMTQTIFNQILTESKAVNEDIAQKTHEVQRQVLFARRAITYAINNASTARQFNLSSLELLYLSYIIYFYGMICEYLTNIASLLDVMQNDAHKVLLKTQEYYTQVFNTYTSQHKLSTFIFIEYAQLDHLIEEFKEKNKETKFTLFSEYIKLLVVKIKEIEVMMITMHNVPK